MATELESYRFSSVPSDLNTRQFLDSLLGRPFILCHDLMRRETQLIFEKRENAIDCGRTSIELERIDLDVQERQFKLLTFYSMPSKQGEDDGLAHPFTDVYSVLGDLRARLFITFMPASGAMIQRMKDDVEGRLSRMDIRSTKQAGRGLFGGGATTHSDLYYDSDDRRLLSSMLGMLNDVTLSNCASYRVGIIIERNQFADVLMRYIKLKALVMDECDVKMEQFGDVFRTINQRNFIPFSYAAASSLVDVSERVRRIGTVSTRIQETSGDIAIGTYLDNAVGSTKESVALDQRAFNLGTLITGLPGTGKSTTAMSIVKQIAEKERPRLVVISPNEEWNGFGRAKGLEIINPYTSDVRINFFGCCSDINIAQFYENLAMLMASASNAGPYRNSIEKCLLAAFPKIYGTTRNPDPQTVYEQIEEEIIEQHAKRTNTSVRYTKHGENVRAALEDLRLILMKPQFAYRDGVDFGEIMRKGVIFDLSSVSNKMKPLFYALILNQVYSISDTLDLHGDSELRLLICIEEAQLIFGSEELSAATLDLGQRIQNFRKKGIALLLVTHNATSINLDIRRLCQNKLYFRQSSDVARYAANDLMFEEAIYSKVIDKLKTLEQFTCALTYFNVSGKRKVPESTIFVQTLPYFCEESEQKKQRRKRKSMLTAMSIKLIGPLGLPLENSRIELYYLGEKLFSGLTDSSGTVRFENALRGRRYRAVVIGEKRRYDRAFEIEGSESAEIRLG